MARSTATRRVSSPILTPLTPSPKRLNGVTRSLPARLFARSQTHRSPRSSRYDLHLVMTRACHSPRSYWKWTDRFAERGNSKLDGLDCWIRAIFDEEIDRIFVRSQKFSSFRERERESGKALFETIKFESRQTDIKDFWRNIENISLKKIYPLFETRGTRFEEIHYILNPLIKFFSFESEFETMLLE